MRAHVLAGLGFLLVLGSVPAFSQAAAETVLLNSNSAAATAKAGTSLGDALNGASKNLGGQLKTVTGDRSHPVPTNHAGKVSAVPSGAKTASKTPAATNQPNSAGSSMITSIQGGQVTSNTAQKPPNTPVGPSAAPQK